ncbi:unnamed protein product [Aphanomyces euteiches]
MQTPDRFNLVEWVNIAWDTMPTSTIINGFVKCKIIAKDEPTSDDDFPEIDASDVIAVLEADVVNDSTCAFPGLHRILGGAAVVEAFWSVVAKFSPEERARLLQFATGTSRVQGFKALTSTDGRVRRFTIQMVQRRPPPTGLMPKGHTCFNRIDLPLYSNKEELAKYLTLVINMESTGFWLE